MCFLGLRCSLWILLSLLCKVDATSDVQKIRAMAGQDCELECQVLHKDLRVLEWTRQDLQDHPCLLLYRDGNLLNEGQDPRFSNRVQLRDPELKTGNLSVVLNNVTLQDSGMYRCFARFETSGGRKEISRDTELTVTEPETTLHKYGTKKEEGGATDTSAGLIAGLIIPVVLLLLIIAVVWFVITYYRKKTQTEEKTNSVPLNSPEERESDASDTETESSPAHKLSRRLSLSVGRHESLRRGVSEDPLVG